MDGFDDYEDGDARSRLEALLDDADDDFDDPDDDDDLDDDDDDFTDEWARDGLDDGPPPVPDEVTPEQIDAVFADMAAVDEAGAESLRAQWGDAAGANLRFATAAYETLYTPELKALLDDPAVGNSPALLDAAAKIGRRLAEVAGDPFTINRSNPTMPTASEATKNRLDELADLQLTDPLRYKSPKVQRELQALYQKVYGTEPLIGGPEGRVL